MGQKRSQPCFDVLQRTRCMRLNTLVLTLCPWRRHVEQAQGILQMRDHGPVSAVMPGWHRIHADRYEHSILQYITVSVVMSGWHRSHADRYKHIMMCVYVLLLLQYITK